MLNASEVNTIYAVKDILTASKDPAAPALAGELDAMLRNAAAARASVAAGQQTRRADAKGRAPSINYIVEIEPGWRATALGSGEAYKLLAEALTELGAPRKLPTQASLAVTLSRSGSWQTKVDTDNGTMSVSVYKPRAPKPKPDAGTDIASRNEASKTHAKNTKTT